MLRRRFALVVAPTKPDTVENPATGDDGLDYSSGGKKSFPLRQVDFGAASACEPLALVARGTRHDSVSSPAAEPETLLTPGHRWSAGASSSPLPRRVALGSSMVAVRGRC